jgi:hypothetical protein
MTRSLFRPDHAATRKELRLGGRDADLSGLDRTRIIGSVRKKDLIASPAGGCS